MHTRSSCCSSSRSSGNTCCCCCCSKKSGSSTTHLFLLLLLLNAYQYQFQFQHYGTNAFVIKGCSNNRHAITFFPHSHLLFPLQSSQSDSTNEENDNATAAQQQYRPGSLMAATAEYGRVPYGEESRKFRRTTFTYEDWIEHRNAEKIITNIQGMFFSGIIRQLKEEVLLVAAVATFVVLWNDFLIDVDFSFGGSSSSSSSSITSFVSLLGNGSEDSGKDFIFHLPKLVLPSLPFTLSSPALGLLLVFKTNASYARWLEARNSWAKIEAQARNVVRMSCTFLQGDLHRNCNNNDNDVDGVMNRIDCEHQMQEGKDAIENLSNAVWLLCRSLMNALSGPEDEASYQKEVMDVFYPSNNENSSSSGKNIADRILSSKDRTMAALAYASNVLDEIPIDEKRRVETDKSLVILGDLIGVCEKIYSSPVPLVCKYT